jgi:uncharacterized protein YkwD
MSPTKSALLVLASALFASLNTPAQKAYYAPAPPEMIYGDAKAKPTSSTDVAQAGTQFSIGDPTDEEQMHLESLNRSRADANAEAQRLIALAFSDPEVNDQFVRAWNVDTNLMIAQFSTNPICPPLSFNAKLINAARGHSQYQFDNAIQSHFEPTSATADPGARATTAGYQFSNLGENVFINATSVQEGHAAFDVDWGPGPGGMQSPPGHRNTIHNPIFVEVGIGVVKGMNTVNGNTAGPQVVTEDFGRPLTPTTYITGVAYYDINGNNFYDLGEGLPGVRVTVDGVSTFAVTTTSGGYSIPVPPNKTYTVRFNATGYPETTSSVTVASDNKKIDFKPAYTAPTATGPGTAFVGVDNVYNITPLPGATGYRARVTQLGALPPEGAEGDLSHLTITTFGGYPFVSTTVKASGANSFHLGHMVDNNSLDPQIIEYNESIHVFPNARVDFKSLLANAGDGEVAEFQVSEDDGATWTTLWSQVGNGIEETGFSTKSADLAQYVGKTVRIRFVFDFVGGNAFVLPPPDDPGFDHVGWFLDDIVFTSADAVLSGIESSVLTSPQFVFRPTLTGTYFLEFQAINGFRTYPYGPAQEVSVASNPPSVSLLNNLTATDTTVTMQFQLTSGTAISYQIVSAPSVSGPWNVETAAEISPDQGHFTVTVPRNGPMRFYRVIAN